jgi:hypothetical protein
VGFGYTWYSEPLTSHEEEGAGSIRSSSTASLYFEKGVKFIALLYVMLLCLAASGLFPLAYETPARH